MDDCTMVAIKGKNGKKIEEIIKAHLGDVEIKEIKEIAPGVFPLPKGSGLWSHEMYTEPSTKDKIKGYVDEYLSGDERPDNNGVKPINVVHKLSYMGGFFDGEGTIVIARRYRENLRGSKLSLGCKVANTNLKSLQDFMDEFGGTIYECPLAKEWHRQAWQWAVNAQKAENFLIKILPYLKIKKPEADVALEFRLLQRKANEGRTNRKGKGRPYTEEDLAVLHEKREQLLSMRGAASNRRRHDKKID